MQKRGVSADTSLMGTDTKKGQQPKVPAGTIIKPEEVYLDNSVMNYDSANFVRVSTFQHGMLLSFGKMHPKAKIVMFREILLPFGTADSLQKILETQLKGLKEQGVIVEIPAEKEAKGDK